MMPTTTEVVSTYEQRTVSVKVTGADPFPLDSEMMTVDRAVIVYRRAQGEPWEFGLVRLVGTSGGADEQAILVIDDGWPEWLRSAVRDNMPVER